MLLWRTAASTTNEPTAPHLPKQAWAASVETSASQLRQPQNGGKSAYRPPECSLRRGPEPACHLVLTPMILDEMPSSSRSTSRVTFSFSCNSRKRLAIFGWNLNPGRASTLESIARGTVSKAYRDTKSTIQTHGILNLNLNLTRKRF